MNECDDIVKTDLKKLFHRNSLNYDQIDSKQPYLITAFVTNINKENEMDYKADNLANDQSIDCDDLFGQYRLECEKWLVDESLIADLDQQKYISLLRNMVKDLLDQNECLILNIMEIKQESANRINELRRNLENTATRTEEVMLALESHELCLKNFVQEHCCECCACDMRLMEFKLCHGSYCDHYSNYNHIQNGTTTISPLLQSHCWSFGHLWNSVVHQTSHWFANKELLSNCLHNLGSEMRFLNLVDLIDTKIHQLENENDQLKKENQMIRELNSLLSYRKGPPLLLNDIQNNKNSNRKLSTNLPTQLTRHISSSNSIYNMNSSLSLSPIYDLTKQENEDQELIHDQYNKTTSVGDNTTEETDSEMINTFFANTSRESFESCECRQDNDSGCSTDLIPSQTDMQSLLALSDLDDDSTTNEDQMIKNMISSMNSMSAAATMATKDNDISHHNHGVSFHESNEIENLRIRVGLADRLVPKLYNKLLYYMNQRNLLLSQFRQENRFREKCKHELSTLTECLMENLKYIETRSKNTNNYPSNILCL